MSHLIPRITAAENVSSNQSFETKPRVGQCGWYTQEMTGTWQKVRVRRLKPQSSIPSKFWRNPHLRMDEAPWCYKWDWMDGNLRVG